jgi:hypothetical protein
LLDQLTQAVIKSRVLLAAAHSTTESDNHVLIREPKMNRRDILLTGLSSSVLSGSGSIAQTVPDADSLRISDLPPLPADISSQASEPPAAYVETEPVGTAKPSDEEKKKAYEILLQSPFKVAPIEIAQYF